VPLSLQDIAISGYMFGNAVANYSVLRLNPTLKMVEQRSGGPDDITELQPLGPLYKSVFNYYNKIPEAGYL
jgi:hypothetical protein